MTFFHMLVSLVCLCALSLAGCQAGLLHLQHQLLRSHRMPRVLRFFPSLQTMEALLFHLTWLGFLCLSVSLVSAVFFISDTYTLSHIHKIFFSLLAWALFAVLLWGRRQAGWRGPTAIRWTWYGLVALLVAYCSSKLIFFDKGL